MRRREALLPGAPSSRISSRVTRRAGRSASCSTTSTQRATTPSRSSSHLIEHLAGADPHRVLDAPGDGAARVGVVPREDGGAARAPRPRAGLGGRRAQADARAARALRGRPAGRARRGRRSSRRRQRRSPPRDGAAVPRLRRAGERGRARSPRTAGTCNLDKLASVQSPGHRRRHGVDAYRVAHAAGAACCSSAPRPWATCSGSARSSRSSARSARSRSTGSSTRIRRVDALETRLEALG